MVLSTCAPGFAFSLTSELFITQSEPTIYQIKAEYLSYQILPVILLLIKEFKIYVLKRMKIVIFFHNFFECG